MGILAWILIGLIAGWLAAKVTDSPRGLLRNLAVGLIGAVIGGFLARQLNIPVAHTFGGELVTALAGAVVLLLILQLFRRF